MFVAHGERSEPEAAAIGEADWRSAAGRRRGPQEVSTRRATGGANYNAIALTDKAGDEVEKYAYSPCGPVYANRTSSRGDFNDDPRVAKAYQETGGCPWLSGYSEDIMPRTPEHQLPGRSFVRRRAHPGRFGASP